MKEKKNEQTTRDLVEQYIKGLLNQANDDDTIEVKKETKEDKKLKGLVEISFVRISERYIKSKNESFLKWGIYNLKKDKTNGILKKMLREISVNSDLIYCCVRKITKNLLIDTLLEKEYLKDDIEVEKIRKIINEIQKETGYNKSEIVEGFVESKFLNDDVIAKEIKIIINNNLSKIFSNREVCENENIIQWIIDNVEKDNCDYLVESIFESKYLNSGIVEMVVEKLKQSDVDLNKKYSNGETILIKVAKADKLSSAASLCILQNDVDVNIQDDAGMTALHHFCSSDEKNSFTASICIEDLLKYDACVDIRDNEGRTPLNCLKWKEENVPLSCIEKFKSKRKVIINYLMNAGAQELEIDKEVKKLMENKISAKKRMFINLKSIIREVVDKKQLIGSMLALILIPYMFKVWHNIIYVVLFGILLNKFNEDRKLQIGPSRSKIMKMLANDIFQFCLLIVINKFFKFRNSIALGFVICNLIYNSLKTDKCYNKVIKAYMEGTQKESKKIKIDKYVEKYMSKFKNKEKEQELTGQDIDQYLDYSNLGKLQKVQLSERDREQVAKQVEKKGICAIL